MTVYHGSVTAISTPRIIRGDRVGDFGVGFYTTTDFEQAKRFVRRKCALEGVENGFVSVYTLPDDILSNPNLRVWHFDCPSNEWVEFVFANRRVALYEHGFDLVCGPVANDQVYASLTLFEDGQIGYDELIHRLMSRKLVDQFLFHTEHALSFLKYSCCMEVSCLEK